MKNNFENSLSVGLVMSMYDFTIPAQVQTISLSNTIAESATVLNNEFFYSEDDDVYNHIGMNGEISWQM